MASGNRPSTCRSSSSSQFSSNLLPFIAVPLILLSGFLAVQNPRSFYSVFSYQAKYHRTVASLSSSSSGNESRVPESSFSAPAVEVSRENHSPVVEVENSSNSAPSELHMVSSTRGSIPGATHAVVRRKFSNLERLEAGLARIRAAIIAAEGKNQTVDDPDYVPTGPMYLNPALFHRSYLEMEKHFKIYVYEDGEPPVFHYCSSRGILGIEGILINQIETSRFRTNNPEKAHVYFLPFSVYSIVSYVYVVNSNLWGPMKNTAVDYIDLVARKYPYWNRSLGYDHFMLACHDWAPTISSAIPNLYKNSIRVLCNANTSERFNPSKDVSLPEIYLPSGTMHGLTGGPSPSRRSILVFYAGGIHGYIREVLMEHWENKDPDVQIHQYLPKSMSYYDMIRKSKFCICPSGYEVASPRMVEALYMGCVPVLMKDHYVEPFSDVLNWKTFAVNVPVKDIPNLKKILTSISDKQYIRMQRRGVQVRKHFEVNFPPKRYDVFHMILHSIWLRRLNIRVREKA